jgi:DNA-binding transcriptional ArsR family regulator
MLVQGDIIKLLKAQKLDLTTSDIATAIGIDRHTASKHLESLQAKGIVECRTVGKSKMWRLSEAPIITALKDNDDLSNSLKQILGSVDDNISIQNNDFKVIWSNSRQDVKGHSCYAVHANNKEKCKDCPMEKTFRTGKIAETIMSVPKHGKVRIITKPIKNDDDETVAVVEIVRKIKR